MSITSVAIVIPVYRESSYIEKTLDSIEKSFQYSIEKDYVPKVILVVNNPLQVSESFRNDNHKLIIALKDFQKNLSFRMDILDYVEPGLKNGVGEARKIGMDFAVSKYLRDPNDRIVSLDADCKVSFNYIAHLFSKPHSGAGFTMYFEHVLDSEAITWYELFLRYLKHGLSLAQSPFDFYAVGSSFGVTLSTYQKVGGMVAKSATEDFHFLNKVRKLNSIDYWTDTSIYPSSRTSQRVTLGTGYFLTEAKRDLAHAIQNLMIPSPQDFLKLGHVLSIFNQFDGDTTLQTLFEQQHLSDIYRHLHESEVIEKVYKVFETTTSKDAYQKRLLEIIDGLETLRILRVLKTSRVDSVTSEVFLDYANSLWKINCESVQELLLQIREQELSGTHFSKFEEK